MRTFFYRAQLSTLQFPILLVAIWSGLNPLSIAAVAGSLACRTLLIRYEPIYFPSSWAPDVWRIYLKNLTRQKLAFVLSSLLLLLCIDGLPKIWNSTMIDNTSDSLSTPQQMHLVFSTSSTSTSLLFSDSSFVASILFLVYHYLLVPLYDIIFYMFEDIYFVTGLIHFLFRFILLEHYVIRFDPKPSAFRRFKSELLVPRRIIIWRTAILISIFSCLLVGFIMQCRRRNDYFQLLSYRSYIDILSSVVELRSILLNLLNSFVNSLILVFCYEIHSLSIQELGDICRFVLGNNVNKNLENQLYSAFKRKDLFETKISIIYISEIYRNRDWALTLFADRYVLENYIFQVLQLCLGVANRIPSINISNYDSCSSSRIIYSHTILVKKGIRGLGEWITLSKTLDEKGGLINLQEIIFTLCTLYEALLQGIQSFPIFRRNSTTIFLEFFRNNFFRNIFLYDKNNYDNSYKLRECLETLFSETECTLEELIHVFGRNTMRDHWSRRHYKILNILTGDIEHPLSMFNLESSGGTKNIPTNDRTNLASVMTALTDGVNMAIDMAIIGGGVNYSGANNIAIMATTSSTSSIIGNTTNGGSTSTSTSTSASNGSTNNSNVSFSSSSFNNSAANDDGSGGSGVTDVVLGIGSFVIGGVSAIVGGVAETVLNYSSRCGKADDEFEQHQESQIESEIIHQNIIHQSMMESEERGRRGFEYRRFSPARDIAGSTASPDKYYRDEYYRDNGENLGDNDNFGNTSGLRQRFETENPGVFNQYHRGFMSRMQQHYAQGGMQGQGGLGVNVQGGMQGSFEQQQSANVNDFLQQQEHQSERQGRDRLQIAHDNLGGTILGSRRRSRGNAGRSRMPGGISTAGSIGSMGNTGRSPIGGGTIGSPRRSPNGRRSPLQDDASGSDGFMSRQAEIMRAATDLNMPR